MLKPACARVVAYFSSLTIGSVLFIAIPLMLLGAGTAVVIEAARAPQELVIPAGVRSPELVRDQPAAGSSSSSSSPAPNQQKSSSISSSPATPAAARAPQPAAGSSVSSSSAPEPASSSSSSSPASSIPVKAPAQKLVGGLELIKKPLEHLTTPLKLAG